MLVAFKDFCADSLRQKKLQTEFADRAKPLRKRAETSKTAIENYMIENDLETAKVSIAGFDPPATFLTRNTKVQSRRITREVIEMGLDNVFNDTNTPSSPRALTKAIWDNVNQARKVDRVVLRIAKKPEGKPKNSNDSAATRYTTDATQALSAPVRAYWEAQAGLKRMRQTKKERESELKERIKARCPAIMRHLQGRNRTSQRVNIRHNDTPCSFYVRIKESSTRPNIKNDTICSLIEAAVRDAPSVDKVPEILLDAFDQVPREVKQRVTLDKGHYQPSAASAASAAPAESVTSSVFDDEAEEVEDEDDEDDDDVF